MNDYFERELSQLELELSRLKTAAQRSSGTVETVSKTITVNMPLSMNASQTACNGSAIYAVDCESNSILNITLDWYYENVMDDWKAARTSRSVSYRKIMLPNGKIGVQLSCLGTNWSADASDDLSKLKNGQSVTITVKLTIQSTDHFTIGAYT